MKIACTGLQPGRLATALMEQGAMFMSADITNLEEFRTALEIYDPDVLIHTAAATGVDWCEENPQGAMAVNARGVDNIVSWWKGRLIYISTDYVFNGRKWFSHGYSEKHDVDPVSVYGTTKLAGELMAANGWSDTTIVRTTVLYGGEPPDFVTWVLGQFDKGEPFTVSSKMVTTPTNIHHLADALMYVAENNISKPIINIVGDNIISRYNFALMIGKTFDKDLDLLGSDNEKSFGVAKRPTRAGLRTDLAKSLGIPIYSIQAGLEKMRKDYYG